ncbi:MAG: isocitrate lyase [Candidatus Promineifilaceae bacterium]|nr:isocitrate lyase [Candidatus Promineifilaceae bacterium]
MSDKDGLQQNWQEPRWAAIARPYTPEEVRQLRGSVRIEYTLARLGAQRLWELIQEQTFVRALGAVTGNQAVQMVQSGLQAIYLSGWQVAADANLAAHTYPDQSLYPMDSAPKLVRRINNALLRADQIHHMQGKNGVHWLAPIVADAESGFGGPLNTFELVKHFIDAGAAAIHLEDQLSSAKKCGHMGGKVLVPASEFIRKLTAARLAADVLDVPTLIIARTDADSAQYVRSDVDELDRAYMSGQRSPEGYHQVSGGLEYAIQRALAYAPYADLIWCETSTPDLGEAREFAQAVHEHYPGKPLAYNCSPSFNWRRHLDERQMATFQEELGQLGYRFQFVTLAGFHALNTSMFELARAYQQEGMAAYSRLQEREFDLEAEAGYGAIKHQSFVGAGYFDAVQLVVSGGLTSTIAMKGSTEEAQFDTVPA